MTDTKPWIIDGDGHVREPVDMFEKYLDPTYERYGRLLTDNYPDRTKTFADAKPSGYTQLERLPGGEDPALRLADMDTDGIERAFLYPTTGLFIQGITERAPALALARAVNDWMADYCAHDPARLHGVGVIPVVDGEDALDEAQRCIEQLGMKGVYRRPEASGVLTVHDPAFEPLWEYLEASNVPIGIHSAYNPLVPQPYFTERFAGNYIAGHAASFVVEAMNALTSFVFYGILERHPRLRVGLVECGAVWAMAYCHRMDEHVESWPLTASSLALKPSEYFRRQVWVSVEEVEPGLAAMLELYPDNVVFESDYPHPDATFPGSTRSLVETDQLTPEQVRAVLRDSALKLYGVDTPAVVT